MTPDSIYLPDLLAPQAKPEPTRMAESPNAADEQNPGDSQLVAASTVPSTDGPPWTEPTEVVSLTASNDVSSPAIEPHAWPAPASAITTPVSRETAHLGASAELERRLVRTSWLLLLATSYGCALTLVLCWLIFTGRVYWRPRSSRTELAASEPTPISPRPDPIPANHRVAIGKALQIGEVEIVPLEVKADGVWLRNTTDSEPRFRKGDSDCLWLRFRVRNDSKSDTFTPLESEFVRQDDRGQADSFIETDGESISVFPLPRSTEWTINGEEFPPVAPGEARELVVVSAGSVVRKLSDHMVWHLRLRVGKHRTETIGIEFDKTDIH